MLKLPYDFDLLFDVKTLEDVKIIANYGPHCSDASPQDLANLFITLGLDLPPCLNPSI